MDPINTTVLVGDCEKVIPHEVAANGQFNLVVTSPPYCDQRKGQYGGVKPDEYVEWFRPKALVLRDCLTSDGSFFLNIKEKAVNGERHTYVHDLVGMMRSIGFLWVDEYIWHKKNSFPGKWPNRFRDAFERIHHFTKERKFKMRQESVMVPTGEWAEKRLANLSANDKTRRGSETGHGMDRKISNWVGRDMAYPSNVLHMATECGNKKHAAPYPVSLPEFFVKGFTDEGDRVLDPFLGSGTTCVAAMRLGRHSVGVELRPDYAKVAKRRLEQEKRNER